MKKSLEGVAFAIGGIVTYSVLLPIIENLGQWAVNLIGVQNAKLAQKVAEIMPDEDNKSCSNVIGFSIPSEEEEEEEENCCGRKRN